MGDNGKTELEEELSLSRRSALAAMGLGASVALAGCNQVVGDQNTGTAQAESSEPSSTQPEGTTEEFNRPEGHTLNEVLPGEKFGSVTINGFTHTLQFSGTREPSWMVRPFHTDAQPESTTYEDIGSGIEYGVIPFPPGKVPILRLNGRIEAEEGVKTNVRISIANRPAVPTPTGKMAPMENGPVRQSIMELSTIGSAQIYDEVYLTDIEDVVMGMDNGHSLPSHTFLFEAKTDSPGLSKIASSTTLALDMEVL